MDLLGILLTGLLAGGVSCAAVQGGLLTGLITRQRKAQELAVAATEPTRTTKGSKKPVVAVEQKWTTTLGHDLVPVGSFLLGKLLSYTAFGALLGALGSTVQLSMTARSWLQIGAGVLIVVLGLSQLEVPGFRRIHFHPPASWARFARLQAKSQSAFAPGLLGLTSILLPCGVTLSVEALALASGSWWWGAAAMAVFVVGTSPLFAVLGYAARRAATAWRGRLALATGLVVVLLGLWTINAGLVVQGSPLAVRDGHSTANVSAPVDLTDQGGHDPFASPSATPTPRPTASWTATGDPAMLPTGLDGLPAMEGMDGPAAQGNSAGKPVPPGFAPPTAGPVVPAPPPNKPAPNQQTIKVTVTTEQFTPNNVIVNAGVPTQLVLVSHNAVGCIRSFVIPSLGIERTLPKDGETVIDLGSLTPGVVHYSCSMGMYTGQIQVR